MSIHAFKQHFNPPSETQFIWEVLPEEFTPAKSLLNLAILQWGQSNHVVTTLVVLLSDGKARRLKSPLRRKAL